MSKHIQLSIDTPCHENWDKMSPVEKGRYCNACQKQVIDFTGMSDSQIATFFKKPSTGSVCGRFFSDQLERDIEIPRKRIPWVKYFFQIALPAFLASGKIVAQDKRPGKGRVAVKPAVTKATKPNSQTKYHIDTLPPSSLLKTRNVRIIPVPRDTMLQSCVPLVSPTPTRLNPVAVVAGYLRVKLFDPEKKDTLTGTVTDLSGAVIPLATIRIEGRSYDLQCDLKGNFSIPISDLTEKVVLIASAYGHQSNGAIIKRDDFYKNTIIQLKPYPMTPLITMGFAVPYRKKPIQSLQQQLMDSPPKFFKVFPNPVASGASLYIEWEKAEEGYYKMELQSASGRFVYSREIWVDAEARLLNLQIPSIAAGAYFLRVTNKLSGKVVAEKIIVQ